MPAQPAPDFIHRFIPAEKADFTLVLLHGTGGDENDLLPLGRRLMPGANLLSIRGKVLENGMPRFFRRIREGVFDEQDLRFRTKELADFLGNFSGPFIAAGYSNGANIAASVLMLRPEVFTGAMLFRAMVPLRPEQPPALTGKPIFLAAGKHDQIVPAENTKQLATMFDQYGAAVTLHWEESDHGLADAEIEAAKHWARAFMRETV
jgi:predicted esterase